MSVRATISSGYRRKLVLIALFLGLFGGWAAYDVFVKYPPEYERFMAYQQMQADGNVHLWPEHAKNAGWPEEEPRRRTAGDFYFNYALMMLLPVALYYAFTAAVAGRRWIEADDQGLRTHDGKDAPYEKITALNSSRWENKGIAVVTYNDAQGQSRRIVLDDFNYETQPVREIYSRVQQHLNPQTAEVEGQDASLPDSTEDEKSANE